MKKILITGCSSGFGLLAAKHFAKKGEHVFASMRNVTGKNNFIAESLRLFAQKNNYKLDVVELDVLSDESVQTAINALPDIDVLINNAGAGYGGPIESFTSEMFMEQLDLNIVGTFRVAKAVLPGMRKNKSGLIIQLSSIAGRCAFPAFGVYHCSKWGLEGLSESMRYELAPHGIDVVMVEPGPFSTNFFENVVPSENPEIAEAYSHVTDFFEGFGNNVRTMFEDENAPTDPMVIVNIFDDLVYMENGERPIRTIGGLDFGLQAINDATEPIRKAVLESMGMLQNDGPQSEIYT